VLPKEGVEGAAARVVRGRPAIDDGPHGREEPGVVLDLDAARVHVVVTEQRGHLLLPPEPAREGVEDLLEGGRARLVEVDQEAAPVPLELGRELQLAGEALGRPEQQVGQAVRPVELAEEAGPGRLGVRAADQRVDDRVEGEVVGRRDPLEEPRVAEQHVVQLVQDQREELLVGPAVRLDEAWVDQEPRIPAKRHSGRGDRLGLLHVEQAQQGLEAVGHGGEQVEQAGLDGHGHG